MPANLVGDNWLRFRARLRNQLVSLKDDGLDEFLGQLELLASKVQPSHGIPADEVERQVNIWQRLLEGVDTGEAADVEECVNMDPQRPKASSVAR